jgi:F-type H+-transporting ATPase subunit gamma
VLITTDRGLAGSLNTNTIRFASEQITTTEGEDLKLITVGRKGHAAMRRARLPIAATFEGFGDRPNFASVIPLSRLLTDDYLAGTYSTIDLIYPRFHSTLVQRPVLDRLLPVEPTGDTQGIPGHQFIFEPNPDEVLRQLMPRYVATRVFQAVLELTASEQSARMVAMKNATENAQELIDDLTLTYNKVRQTNITREMIEIATGAQAI